MLWRERRVRDRVARSLHIEAFIFEGNDLKWWSFASAVALAVLSVVGLVAHESNTERVVHELSVTSGRPRTPASV